VEELQLPTDQLLVVLGLLDIVVEEGFYSLVFVEVALICSQA
jgi:hypothetical protein